MHTTADTGYVSKGTNSVSAIQTSPLVSPDVHVCFRYPYTGNPQLIISRTPLGYSIHLLESTLSWIFALSISIC
jgi:hypothetical protein